MIFPLFRCFNELVCLCKFDYFCHLFVILCCPKKCGKRVFVFLSQRGSDGNNLWSGFQLQKWHIVTELARLNVHIPVLKRSFKFSRFYEFKKVTVTTTTKKAFSKH